MASPSMTLNATAIANQASIGAGATVTSGANALNFSTKLEAQLQAFVTFGTVAATSGLRVDVFRAVDAAASSTFDTIAFLSFVVPSTTSTTKMAPFTVPTGLYQVSVTNLDATNAITNVKVLYATVDGLS
jgi:hypothetical protein